jgi:DNA sulfur modification protein DndB
MSAKDQATDFEKEVVGFLNRLDFKDVNGASDSFRIGGIQVDAVGGHDRTLIVVECFMSLKEEFKPLRGKIEGFRGKICTLPEKIKEDPVYGKYANVRYVLAVKNIRVRHEDIDYANETPRIYIWDENFLKYYEDLYMKIGKYAKFNLLGEMGIRPEPGSTMSLPAFRAEIKGHIMYSFLVDPKVLLEVCYVARRESKKERFYQRLLDKERLRKIRDYVKAGNLLPNNIIVAFREDLSEEIRYTPIGGSTENGVSYGTLEFPKDYRACWIIDGQHRLYSFANSVESFWMPVVAFQKMPLEKQCKIFLDINKYQKPVPPDLLWDLNGDMLGDHEDGIISRVAKALNEDGPLKQKIYVPSKGIRKKKGLLSLSGICNSIKKAGLARSTTRNEAANPFYEEKAKKCSEKALAEGLKGFFHCVQTKMSDDWGLGSKGFCLSNSGIAILISFFELIVRALKFQKKDLNVLNYQQYVNAFAEMMRKRFPSPQDLKQLKARTTSQLGRDSFLREAANYVATQTGDSSFSQGLEDPYEKRAIDIDRRVRAAINLVMTATYGDDWFESELPKIDSSIYGQAKKALGGGDPKVGYSKFTLGQCKALICDKKLDLFKEYFIGPEGFDDEAELEVAFRTIIKVRNKFIHPDGIPPKLKDLELFETYSKIMGKCLDRLEDRFLPKKVE